MGNNCVYTGCRNTLLSVPCAQSCLFRALLQFVQVTRRDLTATLATINGHVPGPFKTDRYPPIICLCVIYSLLPVKTSVSLHFFSLVAASGSNQGSGGWHQPQTASNTITKALAARASCLWQPDIPGYCQINNRPVFPLSPWTLSTCLEPACWWRSSMHCVMTTTERPCFLSRPSHSAMARCAALGFLLKASSRLYW